MGLQAQKFSGVFINARPTAGTRNTSPLLFLPRGETVFASQEPAGEYDRFAAKSIKNHRHTHAAGPDVLYGLFQNDCLCILDETLQTFVLAVHRGAWTRTWLLSLI